MAIPVTGKVLIDTNVFVDYLRQELHADGATVITSNLSEFNRIKEHLQGKDKRLHIVVYWDTPFLIMIFNKDGIIPDPLTALHHIFYDWGG